MDPMVDSKRPLDLKPEPTDDGIADPRFVPFSARKAKGGGILARDWPMLFVAWKTARGEAPVTPNELENEYQTWQMRVSGKHGGRLQAYFYGYRGPFYSAHPNRQGREQQSLYARFISWTKRGITANQDGLAWAQGLSKDLAPNTTSGVADRETLLLTLKDAFGGKRGRYNPELAFPGVGKTLPIVLMRLFKDDLDMLRVILDGYLDGKVTPELVKAVPDRRTRETMWEFGVIPLPKLPPLDQLVEKALVTTPRGLAAERIDGQTVVVYPINMWVDDERVKVKSFSEFKDASQGYPYYVWYTVTSDGNVTPNRRDASSHRERDYIRRLKREWIIDAAHAAIGA